MSTSSGARAQFGTSHRLPDNRVIAECSDTLQRHVGWNLERLEQLQPPASILVWRTMMTTDQDGASYLYPSAVPQPEALSLRDEFAASSPLAAATILFARAKEAAIAELQARAARRTDKSVG